MRFFVLYVFFIFLSLLYGLISSFLALKLIFKKYPLLIEKLFFINPAFFIILFSGILCLLCIIIPFKCFIRATTIILTFFTCLIRFYICQLSTKYKFAFYENPTFNIIFFCFLVNCFIIAFSFVFQTCENVLIKKTKKEISSIKKAFKSSKFIYKSSAVEKFYNLKHFLFSSIPDSQIKPKKLYNRKI